ncbi:MAG TPA: heat-shock protein, partial [bacterium]|nr:heat-shock protein [bacterium]
MSEELDFKISSGLKDIIGKELITDDHIAIFEIVKNSYDANAKKNTITFQNITKEAMEQPRIIVSDDGDGMSKEDIAGKFLFVGYSEKKKEGGGSKDYRDKISERRRRHFAGSKGIGRFSCDRLGKKLKIYTKTEMEKEIHTLTIDWKAFEQDQEKEFETVKAVYEKIKTLDIEDYSVDNFTNGTILVVTELNSPWDRSKLLQLKRYLQRLINPTQIDPELGFEICLEAKEYEKVDEEYSKKGKPWEIINGPIENIVFEKMEMKTARVTSEISEDGKEIRTELFDKDQYIFKIKEKNTYKHLKNVKVIVFFLSTSAKKTFTSTMGLDAVNYGSVFLYKNGIRIYPYGEPNEDWLGLDKLKQQGWKRYLGTREVIGRVEVSGNQPEFVEVSSRDGGLLKNKCHEELKDFIVKKAVTPLRRYVVEGLD